MAREDIYNEIVIRTKQLYSIKQISDIDFARISRLMTNPKVLSDLSLDTLVGLFHSLRINNMTSKIPKISPYNSYEVMKCLENTIGVNRIINTR